MRFALASNHMTRLAHNCKNEHTEPIEVASNILSYLVEHAEAQDTLEGIVEWWLLDRDIRHHIVVVKTALKYLVAKGFVIESRKHNNTTRYRANKQKMDDIRDYLERITVDGGD